MDDLKQLKLVKNIYIVMSLLFCVLGIFLMARPKSSVKMLCVLMGIMLILYGAIKISGYFTRDAFCLAFQFDLAFGVLLAAVGGSDPDSQKKFRSGSYFFRVRNPDPGRCPV